MILLAPGLGPVLFNIYLNDLFFTLSSVKVCNFADDTTSFVCDPNLEVYSSYSIRGKFWNSDSMVSK